MPSVQDYLNSRAPNYASDPRLPDLIIQATSETGDVFKGDLKNKAIFLQVMHWMVLDDRDSSGSGVGGPIKREKEGSLEIEYTDFFSMVSRYPDLTQTRWGLELISLRRKCIFAPRNRFS